LESLVEVVGVVGKCMFLIFVSLSRAVALSLGLTRDGIDVHPIEPHLPIQAGACWDVLVNRVDSLVKGVKLKPIGLSWHLCAGLWVLRVILPTSYLSSFLSL
jgi:hypothetical protein